MLSHSVMSDSLWSYGLHPDRLLYPWNFPGKSLGASCISCIGRWILYCCATWEACYIVYLSPLFQIYLNLCFQVASCRQHAVGSHFYTFSDSFCLLTGVFGTFAFKTITDRVGLKIWLSSSFCYWHFGFPDFFFFFFWLSRFLRYIILWRYRCWACKFSVVCKSSFVCLIALF